MNSGGAAKREVKSVADLVQKSRQHSMSMEASMLDFHFTDKAKLKMTAPRRAERWRNSQNFYCNIIMTVNFLASI